MHFVIYCVDKPDHGHVRAENRPAHLDYLNNNLARIVFAGPLLGDDEGGVMGSLLVVEAADLEEAKAFAFNDPYNEACLFENVTIHACKKVLP